jgi:DNA mismatch repair protein MutL
MPIPEITGSASNLLHEITDSDIQPDTAIVSTGMKNNSGWNFRDSAERIMNTRTAGHVSESFSRPRITNTNTNMNHELELFTDDLAIQSEPDIIYLGQNSGGYLIYDNHEGLVIIDPHAAHERVNYERIKSLAESSSNSQKLLLPVLLHPTLALEANEFIDELNDSGFELANTTKGLELRAIPVIPNIETESEALLRASISALKNHHDGDTKNILWRIWATMACKASVKLTTRLSREDALSLWKSLHDCEQPFVCPHGRPVMIEIKNSDLLKRFGRE